jgi:hypothetical protein
VSNTLAPASAKTAAPPSDTGTTTPPPADDQQPPPLSAEDQAAAAAGDAADAAAAAANGDPPPGAKRRDPGERIQEVVAERNAAMEWGQYWYNTARAQMGQPPPGAPPAGAAPPPGEKPRPLLKDYADADKWAEAVTEWTDERVERGVAAGLSKADAQRQNTNAAEKFQERVAAFRATTPDFDAVTQNPALPISTPMATAIMGSELGPQIFHHLGRNPTEAARIARLPPHQQAIAIGKIEGRLEATGKAPGPGGKPPAPATRTTTQAPPPPNPSRQGTASEVNLANCTLDEYLQRRLPNIAGGGKPRR